MSRLIKHISHEIINEQTLRFAMTQTYPTIWQPEILRLVIIFVAMTLRGNALHAQYRHICSNYTTLGDIKVQRSKCLVPSIENPSLVAHLALLNGQPSHANFVLLVPIV